MDDSDLGLLTEYPVALLISRDTVGVSSCALFGFRVPEMLLVFWLFTS
jgi:hypothetical protein